MTGPDPNSGNVGRGVTPGYLPKGGSAPAQRHDKKQVRKAPAPKPPTKGTSGKGRGGKRGR